MLKSGVDMLAIHRLVIMKQENPAIYQRFIRRVFTQNEIIEGKDRCSYFAGRFAAKEAASKALQCGISTIGWQSVEILHGHQGEPVLHFHGKAALLVAKNQLSEWNVSISHTDELAIAFVIMQ
jgi:holo-[acyl-carrier protein] synthase